MGKKVLCVVWEWLTSAESEEACCEGNGSVGRERGVCQPFLQSNDNKKREQNNKPFLKRKAAIESLLGKKNRSGNCLSTWLCVLFCDAFKNMCTSISYVANGYAYNNTRFCIRE